MGLMEEGFQDRSQTGQRTEAGGGGHAGGLGWESEAEVQSPAECRQNCNPTKWRGTEEKTRYSHQKCMLSTPIYRVSSSLYFQ